MPTVFRLTLLYADGPSGFVRVRTTSVSTLPFLIRFYTVGPVKIRTSDLALYCAASSRTIPTFLKRENNRTEIFID